MSKLSFNDIEKSCMQAITRSPGKYVSERDILKYIVEKYNVTDAIETSNLEFYLSATIRKLDYEDVLVKEINDVLYAGFSIRDDQDINGLINDLQSTVQTERNEKETNPPSHISVVRFVIDNKLKDFYVEDYQGNNVLHYLVMDNDFERIRDNIDTLDVFIFNKNNEGKTPIDLIKDFRISNYFMGRLMVENEGIKSNINIILNVCNDANRQITSINSELTISRTFNFVFLIAIAYSYLSKFIFENY